MSGVPGNRNRKGKPYIKQIDTQQMIDYCLECPWDKCWNCLGRYTDYSYGLRLELKGESDRTIQQLTKGADPPRKIQLNNG